MCGIAGAFRISGGDEPPLSEAALARMNDQIEHRGPDDAGFVVGDGCAFGARRLSIIDVDGGHQPFGDERGRVWGAQNGEIYNHELLRERLRASGHVLRSRCDTEVLPHLYEDHGPDLARHLRGMFAVAVWDRDARRGVLIRDRLGVKPLYYAVVGDVVVFGSELKSVIASGLIDDELDAEAIAAYLMLGYIPAPLTPLAQVRKLHPGERLVIEDGAMRLERYWEYPAPAPSTERRSSEEWAELVRAGLEDSVRMRLMSDVPLGAMLSGGLDSSLIVAIMAQQMDRPVQTFAVGFGGTDSELGDAQRMADFVGAEHHALEVDLQPEPEELERLVWHLDEPLADLSSVGFLALCELAVEDVTVALSGQGADELFGGYRKHRVASLAQHWSALPAPLRAGGAAVLGRAGGRAPRLLDALRSRSPVERLLASSALVRPELRGGIFDGALAEHEHAARRAMERHAAGAPHARPLEAALYLDAKLGLVDDMLTYFDRASMACSLEVRVPFLDHELVELCATIPAHHKVRRMQGKHVLRLAAKGLVPDWVIAKRKRGFFNEAVSGWIGASADAIERMLLAPDARVATVLDADVVRRVLQERREHPARDANLLLALVMLELWLGTYLPRAFALAREGERVAA